MPGLQNTPVTAAQIEVWQWDEAHWRGAVNRVRAGRSLRPTSWPGGARVAVALSFDCDHETSALRDGETSPGRLAQGEFGARVGSPRIVQLLREYDLPATFFVPAVAALLHPGEVRNYVEHGHEVAAHGWIHERTTQLRPDDERALTARALDVLECECGQRPVGLRTPSWDFSDHTLHIIRELGLRYDSSLMADSEPYELLEHGERTGIVEIPVEWIRDDAPYLNMHRFSGIRPYTAPEQVLGIWRDEFDAAHAEAGLFQLTCHPHIIGHRSRLLILRRLIEHMLARSDVWFATHAQVAEHVVAVAPATEAGVSRDGGA